MIEAHNRNMLYSEHMCMNIAIGIFSIKEIMLYANT